MVRIIIFMNIYRVSRKNNSVFFYAYQRPPVYKYENFNQTVTIPVYCYVHDTCGLTDGGITEPRAIRYYCGHLTVSLLAVC